MNIMKNLNNKSKQVAAALRKEQLVTCRQCKQMYSIAIDLQPLNICMKCFSKMETTYDSNLIRSR